MQSETTQSAESSFLFDLMGQFDRHWRKIAVGAGVVVVVGLIIAFYLWRKGEAEVEAGQALSQATATRMFKGASSADVAQAYVKAAAQHPGTAAAGLALLRAGSAFFEAGKYADAQTQFQKFAREYPTSELISQALLGEATCLDAQTKSAEAEQAYKALIDRYPSSSVVPQAKFGLARIYEGQGKVEQAWILYEELVRMGLNSSIGAEAGMRGEELKAKLPSAGAPPAGVPTAVPTASPSSLTNLTIMKPK